MRCIYADKVLTDREQRQLKAIIRKYDYCKTAKRAALKRGPLHTPTAQRNIKAMFAKKTKK